MENSINLEKKVEILSENIKLLKKKNADLRYRLNEEREKQAAASGVLGQFWMWITNLLPGEKMKKKWLAKRKIPLAELSRLTDGIVHDMRNGLGVIRNTIGFLEDDLANSHHESDLRKICHSLDFCELVLRNLSALGGQDVFEPKWVNLEVIVREIFFLLERKLVEVELVVESNPDASQILADEGQMKQVFMNLIKNAGEAMHDGGTLTVRIRRNGEMARIEVSDTGSGILPENQAQLFQEFFTTKDRGYGLGLHIVNTIIKRHGGTIKVQSKVDEGATFILYLPIDVE